uniref:Protein kinase domain-containing protein n=1 Tax=Strigamia maritima TaxID=126957 RepID=T1IZJ7_STRMM
MGQTEQNGLEMHMQTGHTAEDTFSCTQIKPLVKTCGKNGSDVTSKTNMFLVLCRRLMQWMTQVKRNRRQKGNNYETNREVHLTTDSVQTSIASHNTYQQQTDDADDESGFEDDDDDEKDENEDNERLSPEWSIPSADLQFDSLLAHGRFCTTYRGRWHGEVLIHTFTPSRETHVQRFMRQVTALSMIRHENVALFMGACIETSLLAIVMSRRSGPSVYDFVHTRGDSISLSDKISIAHQTAQAMGYIHAKGMVHGCLSSRNVFLEGRVQVSLLDHDLPDSCLDRDNVCCFPRGQITYFSPELMCSLQLLPPHLVIQTAPSQQSDVYAFGTLLYELVTKQWPMQGEHAHSIIWRVSSGKGQSLDHMKAPSTIKDLLAMCWSFDFNHRPSFSQIVQHLQRSVSLHRRYSSSEPERLNRIDQKLAC